MQLPIRVIQRAALHTLMHVIAPRLPKKGAIHTRVDHCPHSKHEKSQGIEELNEHCLDKPVSIFFFVQIGHIDIAFEPLGIGLIGSKDFLRLSESK